MESVNGTVNYSTSESSLLQVFTGNTLMFVKDGKENDYWDIHTLNWTTFKHYHQFRWYYLGPSTSGPSGSIFKIQHIESGNYLQDNQHFVKFTGEDKSSKTQQWNVRQIQPTQAKFWVQNYETGRYLDAHAASAYQFGKIYTSPGPDGGGNPTNPYFEWNWAVYND